MKNANCTLNNAVPTAAAAKGSRDTALQVSSLSLLALRQKALKYQADTVAN